MDIKDFIDRMSEQLGTNSLPSEDQQVMFSTSQSPAKQTALALCVMTSQLHHLAVTMLTSCDSNPLIVKTLRPIASNVFYEVRNAFDSVEELSQNSEPDKNLEGQTL